MDFFVAPPPTAAKPPQPQNGTSSPPLSERYTFDLFVIGKSNELAAAAAHAVSQAPGKVYNPLFLYGDTGLGKTHLMQSIAHETLKRSPDTRITYVGAEQFMNELISSMLDRTGPEFRRRYRETDLLLVDDVQFLKGKRRQHRKSSSTPSMPCTREAVRSCSPVIGHLRKLRVWKPG